MCEERLRVLYETHRRPGWGGHSEIPLANQTLRHTRTLLATGLPEPDTIEVTVEGHLALRWEKNEDFVQAVVNARGNVTCHGRWHGKEFGRGLGALCEKVAATIKTTVSRLQQE